MTRSDRFLNELQERVIVGDGAAGTALFARGIELESGVERMNLLSPDVVLQLHRDYIAAGSRLIETNTFGANILNLARYGVESEDEARATVVAGAKLAREAAGEEIYVAGSVGPLPNVEGEPLNQAAQASLIAAQVTALLEGGVDLLIFESFGVLSELEFAVRIACSITDIPVAAQAAFGMNVRTIDGATAQEAARRCLDAGANLVGANCGYGVLSVSKAASRMLSCGAPVSAFFNAGFPERVEGRLLYLPHQDYIVQTAVELAGQGVRLVGGCCGTDPDVIRAISSALSGRVSVRAGRDEAVCTVVPPEAKASAVPSAPDYRILVELDSPRTLDVDGLLSAARTVADAGASAITIADNPLAAVHVDNIAAAGLVQREVGIPVIPHMTGRDRNKIAIQSAIMGAHVLGIRSLLCITGDPVRMCQDSNTSGVFDLTSVGLVGMVTEFNEGHRVSSDCRTAFSIGVALNPNVRTMSGQIDKLRRKLEAGAHFALTQPVFDESRLDLLQDAMAGAGLEIPVYVGILPLVSARNAEFLHNEVPGILIPEEIRSRMAAKGTVEEQRAEGLAIAGELVRRFAGRVHGFYFICPRNRTELITPLIGTALGAMSPAAASRATRR